MNRTMATGPKAPRSLALLITACVAVACGDDLATVGTGPAQLSATTLRLPLRVHLLTSRLEPIHAKFEWGAVWEMMERVNEIWSQADIVWEIEAMTREFAQSEDEIEALFQEGGPFPPAVIVSILPRDRLFADGWDAFIIHDLTPMAGFAGAYIAFLPAALSSEVDPAGLDDPGRVLAHELGHSLTLLHVDCTEAGNLMAPLCDGQDRTRLSAEQIAQARIQAETRAPATF